MAQQSNVFSDRYEMVKHIARGGMAQVYLAHDLLLDRPVALKVLFPELSVDQNFVERFRREAKAAANLSHPNIVSVYDWGQGDSTYYIVMEFVDGPTLSSLLRQGPLAPERAAAIGASVAAALDFAHRRGVIHRDVKPGNVLIDDRAQVKVADFGIARAAGASEDLTQTGSVMGTATYFSPEQAQGYPVDPRSDVYSLGVVLYEMIAGKPPFSGENPVSIAYKHVKEAPAPPSQVNPAVPAALEAIIMKALAKDPAARYQSAEELRADLVRFVNGEQVAAPTAMMDVLGPPTAMVTRVGGAVPPGASDTAVLAATPGGPPRAERSRAALYTLVALVLVVLALGGYFGGRQAGWFGSTAKTLTVPGNLKNELGVTAQNQLAQAGFTNVRTQAQTSSTVTAGNVIDSDPPGGTKLKSDAKLTLLVSSGAVQVTVPDVTGQLQDAADQALRAAGFVPTNVPTYSSTVQQGTVIATNPPGGQKYNQGAAIQVQVSNGIQPVTVPPVVGDTQTQAGQALGAAGLKVGQTLSEPSSTIKSGLVTRTDPPAGTGVPTGSSVTVYVSSGPPQVTVPDLSGETQIQASASLSSAGLQGSFTTVTVTDPSKNGLVQSQNPAAGSSIGQGSTVTVTIGQYSSTSSSSSSTTSTTPVSPPTSH